jgi:hypothetical protein
MRGFMTASVGRPVVRMSLWKNAISIWLDPYKR